MEPMFANVAAPGDKSGLSLSLSKADVSAQINFATPFWPLVHNIPALYSQLLGGLRNFGISSSAIRTDAGDGTLGAYNVSFWLNPKSWVRIRLESAEFQCRRLMRGELDTQESAFLGLTTALRTAYPELRFAGYVITTNLQGTLKGVKVVDFISTLVQRPSEDLGPFLGSGCVFYFGARGPITLTTVTLDLATGGAEGILVRLHCVVDGTSVDPADLRRVVEPQRDIALNSLGINLELPPR